MEDSTAVDLIVADWEQVSPTSHSSTDPDIQRMHLGPLKPRQRAHDGARTFTVVDPVLLAQYLNRFPNLDFVSCGNIQSEPYDVRRALADTTSTAAVYALRPSAAGPQQGAVPVPLAGGARATLALRRNDLLSSTAPPPGTRLQPSSGVRLVDVHAFPLAPAHPGLPAVIQGVGQDFREVVLHVGGPETFGGAGDFLRAVGAQVEDLAVRFIAPSLLGNDIQADALCHALRVQSCTSLASLTVCPTLIPGAASAMRAQWRLILALIRRVPPQSLRRLRIVVVVEGGGLCASTRGQLKQTRWRDLGAVLPAFTALKNVAVAVTGENSEDSEVWQEIEFFLRGIVLDPARLTYGQGCVI